MGGGPGERGEEGTGVQGTGRGPPHRQGQGGHGLRGRDGGEGEVGQGPRETSKFQNDSFSLNFVPNKYFSFSSQNALTAAADRDRAEKGALAGREAKVARTATARTAWTRRKTTKASAREP